MPTSLITGNALLVLVGLITLMGSIIAGIVLRKRQRIAAGFLTTGAVALIAVLIVPFMAARVANVADRVDQPANAAAIENAGSSVQVAAQNSIQAATQASTANDTVSAAGTATPFKTRTPYPSLTPTVSETPIVLYTQVKYVSTYAYGLIPTSCTAVAKAMTYLRGDPSEKIAAIGTIFAGSLLNVTGRVAGKKWWRVISSDGSSPVEGWVRADYVTADPSCADQEIAFFGPTETPTRVPRTSATSPVTPGPCTLLTTSAVSLRVDPSLRNTPLAQIPAGTALTSTGKAAAGQWWRVAYGNESGWVGGGAVIASSSCASLPVLLPG